ncbi:type III secretion HpaP family protein [Endozoicomonas gorgoniicola]|uniref:Type III secretion HpaP family protein n=1 Tax=Endozoicomonas gorgoniicola TaxID=1234144 RepID=A0ABT3MX85_9GAMM|nr:type III secretion HpaP family protein [Endozoicomonas gorgoniicola]MCW7554000.1 type III secretion HpaP family protein [Endozoicomonas gorgoniicola]
MDGVNQSSQPQASPPPDSSGNQQQVTERQADDFAKKMGKKKDSPKTADKEEMTLESLLASRSKKGSDAERLRGEHGSSRHDKGKQHEDVDTLSALTGNEKQEHPLHTTREVQAPTSVTDIKAIDKVSGPKEINEVINKLVDKIHVSAKDSINGAEVRITMKENILPGTEIRIQRMGGELTVTMNTTSADTHNFLAVNESSLLKSLNERFGDKVQVNINMSGGDQPGDGRSREQYEGEQEQDDNEG